MRTPMISAALCVMLAGCAQQPKAMWLRLDGQRTSNNAVLAQQAEVDQTICRGEMQKANVSGVTFTNGGIAGAVAAGNRANAVADVMKGCMAEKGYVLTTEDQAEAMSAQLAANAAAAKGQAKR